MYYIQAFAGLPIYLSIFLWLDKILTSFMSCHVMSCHVMLNLDSGKFDDQRIQILSYLFIHENNGHTRESFIKFLFWMQFS